MLHRTSVNTARFIGRALRRISLVVMPTLLLAGCGNPKPDPALEARIAAAEAKAEAADKRSKQALSMAATGSSSTGGTVEAEPVISEGEPVADDGGFDDGPSADIQPESAAPIPIMPGG